MTPGTHSLSHDRDHHDTKARILEVAERLFMEHGFSATSLRMITGDAKVNLASVNYHFGSKEALIEAVFNRRLAPLNRERVAQLNRMEEEANGEPLTVEQIVDAFVMSASRMGEGHSDTGMVFLRLLGRTFSDPASNVSSILAKQYSDVVVRFKRAMARALPALPEDELVWRMHFMFGTMAYTNAGMDAIQLIASCESANLEDQLSILRRVSKFVVAGLKAPL
ncbi:MAG TPA: TetR/AcrR family transcriptional regulator [Burkholderiales bacterium]|nr:TetR/AcrR family transcriptional regulator [Burkholderiales bacterium]